MAAPLFARLLGADMHALAPRVRAMHAGASRVRARGYASVAGSPRFLARVVRAILCLPSPTTETAIALAIERTPTGERWTRDFANGHRGMISHLSPSRRWPHAFDERLGPTQLTFAPIVDNGGGMHWNTRQVRMFAVPLPLGWFRGLTARCAERNNRYVFDIRVQLPLIGLLVAYSGWLEIVPDE